MKQIEQSERDEWWTQEEVRDYLRISYSSVHRHRVLWTDTPPKKGQWRYKFVRVGATDIPRIWARDVKACLHTEAESEDAPIFGPCTQILRAHAD